MLKKIATSYDAFLATGAVYKNLPRIIGLTFNKAGKPPVDIRVIENAVDKAEEIRSTLAFHIKKCSCLGVVVGNVSFQKSDIFTNLEKSISHLAAALKKSWQNIKSLHLKSTMGKPYRLY